MAAPLGAERPRSLYAAPPSGGGGGGVLSQNGHAEGHQHNVIKQVLKVMGTVTLYASLSWCASLSGALSRDTVSLASNSRRRGMVIDDYGKPRAMRQPVESTRRRRDRVTLRLTFDVKPHDARGSCEGSV